MTGVAATPSPPPGDRPTPPSSGRPSPPRGDRFEQFIESRQMRKGMRPRNAAYLIASFWFFAVVVFGVIERVADPKTFKTIWLAFWWAIQTVTTVGYGDIVPTQASGKFMAAGLHARRPLAALDRHGDDHELVRGAQAGKRRWLQAMTRSTTS